MATITTAAAKALIVHELAEQLTLEDAITKGTWLQVFKDAAPHQKTMILALCKYLGEEGNEDLPPASSLQLFRRRRAALSQA